MIRPITYEVTDTWGTVLASYSGVDATEAELLAARIAGDPRLDTRRVHGEADVDDVLETVDDVIDEVGLEDVLDDASAEPALREELREVLRRDLDSRLADESPPGTDVNADATQTGLAAGHAASERDGDDRPTNAAELYEYLDSLDLDQADIEAVLADLRDDRDDD